MRCVLSVPWRLLERGSRVASDEHIDEERIVASAIDVSDPRCRAVHAIEQGDGAIGTSGQGDERARYLFGTRCEPPYMVRRAVYVSLSELISTVCSQGGGTHDAHPRDVVLRHFDADDVHRASRQDGRDGLSARLQEHVDCLERTPYRGKLVEVPSRQNASDNEPATALVLGPVGEDVTNAELTDHAHGDLAGQSSGKSEGRD